jgi:hypothetical protein
VIGHGLGAGPADPAAVLLQTPQHHLVAVIHLGAAKPRDVACTGIVALLRRRRRSHQNQWNNQNKPSHLVVPSCVSLKHSNLAAAARQHVGVHHICAATLLARRKSIGWGERPSGGQRSLGSGESSDPGSAAPLTVTIRIRDLSAKPPPRWRGVNTCFSLMTGVKEQGGLFEKE